MKKIKLWLTVLSLIAMVIPGTIIAQNVQNSSRTSNTLQGSNTCNPTSTLSSLNLDMVETRCSSGSPTPPLSVVYMLN